jgi:hypothetical protein
VKPCRYDIKSAPRDVGCFIPIAFQLCCRLCLQKVLENQEELEFNETYQILVYADYVNILSKNLGTINKN